MQRVPPGLLAVAFVVAVSCGAAAVAGATPSSTAASAATDPCNAYTRCSECVYDAFPPMSLEPLPCKWCEETATCSSNVSATCPSIRRITDDPPQCSDMQCSAAKTTGNIYWCRANTVAAAFFSFELLLLTCLYWIWLRAVQQLPWKYPSIHRAVDQVQASAAAPGATVVQLVSRARESQNACPICHVNVGKSYPPGSVCFWCDVARFSFVPFVIGLACSCVSICCLFSLTLRPSFADWYYAVLLTVPHAIFVAFGAWVGLTQRPVHGDEEQRKTTFVELALLLRGRNLSTVFELVSGGIATPPVGQVGDQEGSGAADPSESVLSEADQHVDTMQSLELDTSIPSSFRAELRDALRSDEFIAWTEQPSSTVILVDNRWLISSFGGGMVVGLFLLLLASIQPSAYPATVLAAPPTRAAGFVVLFFCFAMLSVTVSSVNRLYVLTNRRLLFLASGMFGSTTLISTELADVKYASVHGYQELGYTVLSFGWGRAAKPTRKMPPLRTSEFVGVVGVDDLLRKFSEFCDSLDSSAQKATTDQRRMTWRVHIGVLSLAAAIAPVLFVSSRVLPADLALLGLLIWWFFCGVFAQRGWRVLSTTSAHLNLAKEWGRYGGGFSLSRLVPGVFGRRLPQKPAAVIRSVAQPQSPSAAANNRPKVEL